MSFSQQETSVRIEGLPAALVDIDLANTFHDAAVLGDWVGLTERGDVVFGHESWVEEHILCPPVLGSRICHADPRLAVVLDPARGTLIPIDTNGPGSAIEIGPHPQELVSLTGGRLALTYADQGYFKGPFDGGVVILDAGGRLLDRIDELESYGACRLGDQALVFGLGTREAVFYGRTAQQSDLQRRLTLPDALNRAFAPTALFGRGPSAIACLRPTDVRIGEGPAYEQLVWTPTTGHVSTHRLRAGAPMSNRSSGRYVEVSGNTVVVRKIRATPDTPA